MAHLRQCDWPAAKVQRLAQSSLHSKEKKRCLTNQCSAKSDWVATRTIRRWCCEADFCLRGVEACQDRCLHPCWCRPACHHGSESLRPTNPQREHGPSKFHHGYESDLLRPKLEKRCLKSYHRDGRFSQVCEYSQIAAATLYYFAAGRVASVKSRFEGNLVAWISLPQLCRIVRPAATNIMLDQLRFVLPLGISPSCPSATQSDGFEAFSSCC